MSRPNNLPSNILNANQFNKEILDYIYILTNTIRQFDKSKDGLLYLQSLLKQKRTMLYFTQPSTRTFLSFDSACKVLGMATSEIRDTSISSEFKGESIEDSIRTFSSYVDLIVMRSPQAGLCERTAKLLKNTDRSIPIINAGSGLDEHPTQALLDIYTLQRSFSSIDGIDSKKICMVGDLKRGRTIRSLSKILVHYKNVELIFCSPEEFKIENDLKQYLLENNISFTETTNFKEAIAIADAIYMTRIQDEWDDKSKKIDYSTYKNFHLKREHLDIIKNNCVIMHPMPRREELDVQIDSDPRAKYWRQERNGMWVRIALMTIVLNVDQQIVLPKL